MYLLLGPSMILVSAGLAIATYFGLRLVIAPKQDEGKESEAIDVVNEVSQLGQRLATPELRQMTTALCIKARTLLNQLANSKDAAAEALFLVRQYMEQTRNGLRLYLAEGRRSRSESEKVLTQLLSTVSGRFDTLQISLDTQDDQALAGELKLLTKTLTDLDQISVNLGQGNP